MIRVEIVASTLQAAENLAFILTDDNELEMVSVKAFHGAYRPDLRADVVLASEVVPPAMPASGPKLVLLSEEARWPRNDSVRASLPLDALPHEIAAAVIAAHADLYALTSEQLHTVPNQPQPKITAPIREERLTPREIDVLRMLADGGSNKQIGLALGISSNTAKFHVAQILAKLGVSTRAEAVRVGIRRGLILL